MKISLKTFHGIWHANIGKKKNNNNKKNKLFIDTFYPWTLLLLCKIPFPSLLVFLPFFSPSLRLALQLRCKRVGESLRFEIQPRGCWRRRSQLLCIGIFFLPVGICKCALSRWRASCLSRLGFDPATFLVLSAALYGSSYPVRILRLLWYRLPRFREYVGNFNE